jgi:hypothetical protein
VSRATLKIRRYLLPVLLAVPALAAAQDIYIEARTHTDAVKMMGQSVPARDGVTRTWVGENKIAIHDETGGNVIVFRGDLEKMYILFPRSKTFYESPIPFQYPPQVAKMLTAMKPEVSVTPTTQSKVVNGFNTTLTKVNIKMMGQDVSMDYWLSKDVGVPREQIRRLTEAMAAGNPMLAELGRKMSEI